MSHHQISIRCLSLSSGYFSLCSFGISHQFKSFNFTNLVFMISSPLIGHYQVQLIKRLSFEASLKCCVIRKMFVALAAYFALRRQRRNAGTQNLICHNGTIIPFDSSSSIKAAPKVHINGPSRDLSKGTDVTFKCTVVSTLAVNVTWLFNGVPIMEQDISSRRHNFLDCLTVLHIKIVSTKDVGNYTCVAQNAIGQATASSRLSLHRK